jgi:hypothetical protein
MQARIAARLAGSAALPADNSRYGSPPYRHHPYHGIPSYGYRYDGTPFGGAPPYGHPSYGDPYYQPSYGTQPGGYPPHGTPPYGVRPDQASHPSEETYGLRTTQAGSLPSKEVTYVKIEEV